MRPRTYFAIPPSAHDERLQRQLDARRLHLTCAVINSGAPHQFRAERWDWNKKAAHARAARRRQNEIASANERLAQRLHSVRPSILTCNTTSSQRQPSSHGAEHASGCRRPVPPRRSRAHARAGPRQHHRRVARHIEAETGTHACSVNVLSQVDPLCAGASLKALLLRLGATSETLYDGSDVHCPPEATGIPCLYGPRMHIRANTARTTKMPAADTASLTAASANGGAARAGKRSIASVPRLESHTEMCRSPSPFVRAAQLFQALFRGNKARKRTVAMRGHCGKSITPRDTKTAVVAIPVPAPSPAAAAAQSAPAPCMVTAATEGLDTVGKMTVVNTIPAHTQVIRSSGSPKRQRQRRKGKAARLLQALFRGKQARRRTSVMREEQARVPVPPVMQVRETKYDCNTGEICRDMAQEHGATQAHTPNNDKHKGRLGHRHRRKHEHNHNHKHKR